MKNLILKPLTGLLTISIILLSCVSVNSQTVKTKENMKLYFFKCSVSDDLYGASPNKDGNPLPTPGGGQWLPIEILDSNHPEAIVGFDTNVAQAEIAKYGCHWFTTKGPRDIYWGDEKPPKIVEKQRK